MYIFQRRRVHNYNNKRLEMAYYWTFRFALAHEGNKCRRAVILEYFGEDPTHATSRGGCCDVCSSTAELADYKDELATVVRTVSEIPGYGEVKVNILWP